MKQFFFTAFYFFISIPVLLAQITSTSQAPETSRATFAPISRLIESARSILEAVLPMLISGGVLFLFWTLAMFTWKGAHDPTSRDKYKQAIMWSIIAILLMITVYGVIQFMADTLHVETGGKPQPFKLPGER